LREVWSEVNKAVSVIIDHTTLQDLCDRFRATNVQPAVPQTAAGAA
jgi:hypothetical protein